MRRKLFRVRFLGIIFSAVLAGGWPVAAQAAGLGAAAGFAVLASKAVTCTGPNSNVTGPVGVSTSATAITKTGCTMNVQVTAGAYAAFQTAYSSGLGRCSQTLASTLPGVTTLSSGTYCTPAALTLTTATLNLTGAGPWNFEIGTPGTGGTGGLTATGLHVIASDPCKVFWWVRQDVTLTTSTFQGTILGGGDITLTDTTLTGRAWATGAVTLTRSPILGCTAAGTVPGTQCGKDGDTDEDNDSDKSKDTADNDNSGERVGNAASERSDNDGKDERGLGAEDCVSGKSDNDKKDNDKKDNDKKGNEKKDTANKDTDKKDDGKANNGNADTPKAHKAMNDKAAAVKATAAKATTHEAKAGKAKKDKAKGDKARADKGRGDEGTSNHDNSQSES